jgi:hypothetical protein
MCILGDKLSELYGNYCISTAARIHILLQSCHGIDTNCVSFGYQSELPKNGSCQNCGYLLGRKLSYKMCTFNCHGIFLLIDTAVY